MSYIGFCEEVCVPTVKSVRFGNDKPWFCKTVKDNIAAKNEAFRAGDVTRYKQAKAGVRREIRKAKAKYRAKIEAQLTTNNTRVVCDTRACSMSLSSNRRRLPHWIPVPICPTG